MIDFNKNKNFINNKNILKQCNMFCIDCLITSQISNCQKNEDKKFYSSIIFSQVI